MPCLLIKLGMKTIFLTILLTTNFSLLASYNKAITTLHNKCYTFLDTNLDSAIILANNAELLAQQNEDPYLQAKSLFIKAYAFRMKDDLGKSFIANLGALELLENSSTENSINMFLDLLLNTGEILLKHYAYPEGIQYFDRGIKIAQQGNIQNRLLLLLFNKGMALRYNGKYDEALATFDQTLRIATELGDELRILRSLNQKGLTLKDLKSYDLARTTHMKMVNFQYNNQSSDKYRGQAWHNIGLSYLEEGNLTSAKEAYEKAIKSFNATNNNSEELFLAYMDLSETFTKLGQVNQAFEYAQLCETLYGKCELSPDNYNFFNLMSEIAHLRNDTKMVRYYAQKYVDENQRFLNQQQEILEIKDRFKMEVLAAGFFSEIEANKNISLLERVLWTIASIFTIIILITKIHTWYKKRSLSLQINLIKEEGPV